MTFYDFIFEYNRVRRWGGVMEKTIYADLLFLMNLGGDILTLWVTARLCRLMTKPSRIAAGAATGAVLSVFITVFLDGAAAFAAGIPTAAFMCLLAFGKTSFPDFLRRTAIMWSSACLFFGVVSSFSSAVNRTFGPKGRTAAAIACAGAVPAVLLVSRFRRDKAERRSALVTFSVCGEIVKILCLVDSGNLLREPVTGDPVLVVASEAVPQIPKNVVSYILDGDGDPPPVIMTRLRIIPARSVSGEEIMRAVRPDVLTINGKERSGYIVLRDARKGSFGTYDGIVPSSIT